MAKKSKVGLLVLLATFLAFGNIYAQEPIDYKQLMAKCSEAIKQVKSYNVELEAKNYFTINSQENKGNSAKLNIAFVSPDKFKVEQVLNEDSNENLWDGWIVIGNDYYEFRANPPAPGQDLNSYRPALSWAKGDDDNRKAICKNNSSEGIIKQLEEIEKKYKRESISPATKDGTEYFVIKYLFGKELVDIESLPPELKNSKVNGTYEIWINKKSYLPSKQSEKVSYYSNEQNKGAASTDINYSSYNENKIKIDEPALGSNVF